MACVKVVNKEIKGPGPFIYVRQILGIQTGISGKSRILRTVYGPILGRMRLKLPFINHVTSLTPERLMWRLVFSLLYLVAPPTAAASLNIAFGQSLAPFADEQTGRGIEIDILRAALRAVGHEAHIQFVPLARVPVMLEAGQVDAAATLTPDFGKRTAYSDVYIRYRNVVIAPKGRFPAPFRLEDLRRSRIVAFRNAKIYLGPKFAAIAEASPGYYEESDQLSQTRLLFAGHADAIVTERLIYAYQVKALLTSHFPERPIPVDVFDVFPESPYRVGFRDPKYRDDFNRGLAVIRNDGSLAKIEAAYRGSEKP